MLTKYRQLVYNDAIMSAIDEIIPIFWIKVYGYFNVRGYE